MASNDTVTLTFKVNEDGSLKVISQDAEKAAKSTDKAAKSADNFSKKQKGVAQAGMNGTKAFSKMQQNLGGSNGLVAAYAGLAANIFALTAGFGALSRAARATQLEAGLVAMGEATGVAMHSLSKGLVEATNNAISLEESMRSVALITSAGIDPSSVERFGEVARKASVALGRDLQDSMNRLTRGVTKLEPELLDELGIMVRLDEATKTYADSIGKSASDLTNFEKRQAFLNATLAEGEAKFGALGDVDVNPYDRLSATLQNITKNVLGGLSAAFEPLIGYLSSSPMALVGVLALFGSTISGVVLGSLHEMAEGTANLAEGQREHMANQMSIADGNNRASKTMSDFTQKVREGTVSQADLDKAMIGQAQSQKTNISLEKRGVISKDELNARLAMSTQQIYLATAALNQHNLAQVQDIASTAQLAFANGDLLTGFKLVGKAFKATGRTMRAAILNTVSLKTAFSGLTISASALTASLKALGAGFMAMLGPLGIVLSVGMLIFDMFKGLFNMMKSDATKEFEAATDNLADAQKELSKNLIEVDRGFASTSRKILNTTDAYIALDNVLGTFLEKYGNLETAAEQAGKGGMTLSKALDKQINSSKKLKKDFENFAKSQNRSTKAELNGIGIKLEFIEAQKKTSAAFKNVSETAKAAQEAVSDYLNASRVKTSVDEITAALGDTMKSLFNELGDGSLVIRPEFEDVNFAQVLAENITPDQALVFGIAAEQEELAKIMKIVEPARKQIAASQDAIKGTSLFARLFAQDDLDALEKGIATAQKQIDKAFSGKSEKELVDTIKEQLKFRKGILLAEQSRQIVSKNNIAQAKAELATQKALAANTQASINALIDAQINYNEEQQIAEAGNLQFLLNERATLEAKESLTKEEKKRVSQLTSQIGLSEQQLKLLQAQGNEIRNTAELERKKTALNAVKEDQKAQKAVLDTVKRITSALKERLKISQQITEVSQRMANRAAGREGELTPAQKAANTLDKKTISERMRVMKLEASTKIQSIKMEKTLLQAKMAVLREEINVINKKRELAGEEKIATETLDAAIASLNAGGGGFDLLMANVVENLRLQLGLLVEETSVLDVNALKIQRIMEMDQKRAENLTKVVDAQQSVFDELKKQSDIQTELANLGNTDALGGVKSQKEAARIAEESRRKNEQLAQLEYELKIATISAEQGLLDAKFALLEAEMRASGGGLSQTEANALNAAKQVLEIQRTANSLRMITASDELKLTQARIQHERDHAVEKAGREGGLGAAVATKRGMGEAKNPAALSISNGAIDPGQKFVADKITANVTVAQEANNILRAIESNTRAAGAPAPNIPPASVPGTGTPTTPAPTLTTGTATSTPTTPTTTGAGSAGSTVGGGVVPGVAQSTADLSELRGMIVGTANDLALLGPEGEAASQVLMGAETMTQAFDSSASKAERLSAVVSGAAQMMAGASAAKIAGIEKEIKAEKKRDGKSAASVQKLKALEKKKEAEKKKAFDRNKKMKMAETIINTADAIMEYVADQNYPMAAASALLGAAQLAIISKTSYDGGGSAPGAPSEISHGDRKNRVDTSRAQNARGELAYMRGQRGQGTGMTDFKPAFTGYKHRAQGGYIVGEQGPELFVPQTSGEIVPAGEVDAAMQAPANVTFNISAVDANGVEELLVGQRDNIIGMIREAANQQGQDFLEDLEVDTTYGV